MAENADRITILIVDDEPAIRMLVASSLAAEGYTLLLAGSADEALRLSAAHIGRIDLLLTDATMPGGSGLDLAGALLAARPDLPVIVMSGYTEDTLNVNGLEAPVVVVHKPFTPQELRQRVRDVLMR